jgi:hypothetical protein
MAREQRLISYKQIRDTLHHLHPIQTLLSSIQERGQDGVREAPLPVGYERNTHTYLRPFRCRGQGIPERDTGHQAECYREHISFPCVPPRGGNERLCESLVGVRHHASEGTEDYSGITVSWIHRAEMRERAIRSAFARSLEPSCQQDSCQYRPSRKIREVLRGFAHRAQWISWASVPSCISPSDFAAVLSLVTAHGSYVSIELPAKPATRESTFHQI